MSHLKHYREFLPATEKRSKGFRSFRAQSEHALCPRHTRSPETSRWFAKAGSNYKLFTDTRRYDDALSIDHDSTECIGIAFADVPYQRRERMRCRADRSE